MDPDAGDPAVSDLRRTHQIDAYAPAEIARRVHDVGVAKSRLSVAHTLALSVLAGAFIAVGAAFATAAMTDTGLGTGPTRVLGGVTFSLGLILVVVAGAELFTGNNLVAMAWASRAISTRRLVRNWVLVYVGNLVGALVTAVLVTWSGVWAAADCATGLTAVRIAVAKTQIPVGEALVRGILCNALVCLAVWLCQSGRSTVDRILAVIWPVSAFVVLGFEHCVANMYFVPLGMALASRPELAAAAEAHGVALDGLDLAGFLHNLLPVTLGNVVGGTLLVAAIYGFVYLRGTGGSGTSAAGDGRASDD